MSEPGYNSFITAYNRSLSHEGLYANNPSDKGGETWKGIARNLWPDWLGWELIDSLKKSAGPGISNLNKVLNSTHLEALVQIFYKRNFFDTLSLGRIGHIEVVCELFDTAINQGTQTAGTYLQQALNLLNNNGKFYPELKVDGVPGQRTMEAYEAYMKTSNLPGRSEARNIKTLLTVLNGLQFEKYRRICERNPGQETFIYGWLNRVGF